jgi:hypothetical protein
MKKEYVYFVTYVSADKNGMLEYKTDKKIEKYNDVVNITKEIKELSGKKAIILN